MMENNAEDRQKFQVVHDASVVKSAPNINFIIGISNDHKGNYQSYSCGLVTDDYNDDILYDKSDFYQVTGYGATKTEAIEDFKNKIRKVIEINQDYIENFNKKLFSNKIIDADFVFVDCNMNYIYDKDGKIIQITQIDEDNDV